MHHPRNQCHCQQTRIHRALPQTPPYRRPRTHSPAQIVQHHHKHSPPKPSQSQRRPLSPQHHSQCTRRAQDASASATTIRCTLDPRRPVSRRVDTRCVLAEARSNAAPRVVRLQRERARFEGRASRRDVVAMMFRLNQSQSRRCVAQAGAEHGKWKSVGSGTACTCRRGER